MNHGDKRWCLGLPRGGSLTVCAWRLKAGQEPFREAAYCCCFSSLKFLFSKVYLPIDIII